jgi:dTDP-4-amino-4,6-dideoxygalactose transaminase
MSIPLVDLKAQYQNIRPVIDTAIQNVLESTQFIQGPAVREFEEAFAKFCGAQYAVGLSSGTSALFLALQAAGVGQGDEVITPAHTFTATAEAIVQCGATPVFVDIDPATYLMDVECALSAVTRRTKAIMPVHLYGQMAPVMPLRELAESHGLALIEDAAQAHGATSNGEAAGISSTAAIYSFYPGKNLGAFGDAGALVTNNTTIAERVKILRDHGRRDKYEHIVAGYGERMDTLQAAILLAKLAYLSEWNQLRQSWAARYDAWLADLPIVRPSVLPQNRHVYHLYVIRLPQRESLRKFLSARGISSGVHYPLPLHLQPAYSYLGYQRGSLPHTELAADEVLSLPLYPELTEAQVRTVCDSIREYFAQ